MNNSERDVSAWANANIGTDAHLDFMAGDASFRRYFRVHQGDQTWVLMDAPPEKEDVRPFLKVRGWLETAGLRVPHVMIEDISAGFLLLEDFGDTSCAVYLESAGDADAMFTDALRQIHLLQSAPPEFSLPCFNLAQMRDECALYLDWYLPHIAKHTPSQNEREDFHASLSGILTMIDALPHVPVHRDYHSRNLMLPQAGFPLGVIDFQDAVMGAITYDPASLLYDCYQDYGEPCRLRWSRYFYESLPVECKNTFDHFEHWHQLLRLTALQRHIKAIGIFSRLAIRDGKRQFLEEIPLTRNHLQATMHDMQLKLHPMLQMSMSVLG